MCAALVWLCLEWWGEAGGVRPRSTTGRESSGGQYIRAGQADPGLYFAYSIRLEKTKWTGPRGGQERRGK